VRTFEGPLCHCWHGLLEDVAAFRITPIMHDGMERYARAPRDLVGSVDDGSRFENVAPL
jgi:hypothetical protein